MKVLSLSLLFSRCAFIESQKKHCPHSLSEREVYRKFDESIHREKLFLFFLSIVSFAHCRERSSLIAHFLVAWLRCIIVI